MSTAIERLIEAEGLPAEYREIAERYWRPLSEDIAERYAENPGGKPLIVGINGAQGSGKSTLCKFLEVLLVEHNQVGITLSLDDLYLTRAERLAAAADDHPLFATRGVPGTHDVELGMAIRVSRVAQPRCGRRTTLSSPSNSSGTAGSAG
jgi:D-glycerate 3-kinase